MLAGWAYFLNVGQVHQAQTQKKCNVPFDSMLKLVAPLPSRGWDHVCDPTLIKFYVDAKYAVLNASK